MTAKTHRNCPSELTAVGLFCGCGGLDLGAKRAGFKVVAAYDKDEVAIETYRKNVSPHAFVADMTSAVPNVPTGVDLLLGGPPCQGFSSAGPKQVDDPRNRLWTTYLEVIDRVRPRAFVLENVYGFAIELESFFASLRKLTGNHYRVEHRKINAQFYGVPQHRLRLFVCGLRTDIAKSVPWPVPTITESWGYRRWTDGLQSIADVLQDLGPSKPCEMPRKADWSNLHEHLQLEASHREVARLIPNGGSLRSIPDEYLPVLYRGRTRTNRGWTWYYRKPVPTLPARTVTASTRPIYSQVLAPDVHVVPDGSSWKWISIDPIKHTDSRGLYISPVEQRRLSVRECARLQTFPDDFQFYGTIFDKHRQIGNAVPVALAEQLCNSIRQVLQVEKPMQPTRPVKVSRSVPGKHS